MTKIYFLKIFLLLVLFCQVLPKAQAQNYAIGGTAGPALTGSVYWLTWDPTVPGSKLISAPNSSDAQHITNGTYVWQYSPTVRITAIISNEQFVNAITMQSYTPGNFVGDGLDLLYSGNNLPKPGSRGVAGSGLATTGNSQASFDIDVKVAILINGVYTDVVYPGMVIADAESIDSQGEFISGDTPNPVAWQLLNKRTQNDPSDSHYLLDLSNGGRSFKLRADLAPGNFGVQAVMFAHNARSLTNLTMFGSGITAMAIGFVLPFDLGDGPASYGSAGHYIDNFAITDFFAGDGTYAVVNYNTTPLIPQANVYIGANNVDADGDAVFTSTSTNDDANGNDDEATLTPGALADIKVNQPGSYSVSLPVTNNKNIPATLYGWIDFNGDGVFAPDEVVTAVVPANANNQTITLTYPNALFTNKIKAGLLYARFRITTTSLTDDISTLIDERSTAFAADGEAEDYKLKNVLGVTLSGTVHNDPNGNLNGVISGNGLSSVSGSQLIAYLVSGTSVIDKAIVSATGTYSFTNVNNGTYTVAISTNNVAVGSTLASVAANLPLTWVASGEAFGVNNSAGTGIESGTPNLQITVSTPGSNLDVSGLDFGIDQAPVAVTDNVTVVAGTAIPISVLTNDTDADGTIDVTSVRVIDPADNVAKTTVTIPNQGTYVVNTTTGVVTFTPLVTFSGASTPVTYTIKDNFGAPAASNVIAQISVAVRPKGAVDSDITLINTPVTTSVKANDGSGNTNATVIAGNGANGTTTVNPAGQVTYTPNNGFNGTDTYTYTLTNGALVSDPITVSVLVSLVPIGVADKDSTVATAPITPVTTAVLANDGSFITGSTVNAGSVPAHGSIVVNADRTITYTPALNFTGVDTYTYTITKNAATSAPITVAINVKPVAFPDTRTTAANTPIAIAVKNNETASATGTTVQIVTPPTAAMGTATVDAAGIVTFTPTAGISGGTATFTYRLVTADGLVSAPVTVTVNVSLPLPVGSPDFPSTTINTPNTNVQVLANDADGTTGVITVNAGPKPAHGTIVVNANNTITYTPDANYIGADPFTYTFTKNGQTSLPITVNMKVKPVGVIDAVTIAIGAVTPINVKTNDQTSANGTTVKIGTAPTKGTVTVNAAGVITYTPLAGFTSGTDTFTYILTSPDGSTDSDPITVNVTINPADSYVTNANTPRLSDNVTVNDGPAAVGATVSIQTPPAHGTATVNADNTVNYTPAANYAGLDSYTYILTNGAVVSAPIPVTIRVKPVGTFDGAITGINQIATTDVKNNDGATAIGTTVIATNGANGITTVDANGIVTYTPNPGFTGTDTYTYVLRTPDGVVSDPISVTVTVKLIGQPDALTIFPRTTSNATSAVIKVKDNDNASGALPNVIVTATAGAHGTTSVDASGTVTYTPQLNYVGTDTYTYTLSVPGAVSDPITVTITMKSPGLPDDYSTNVNTPVTYPVKQNDGTLNATATVITANVLHGATTVNANGQVVFTPETDFIGTATYTYTLTTNGAVSDPLNVTVTVRPVGVVDVFTTSINKPVPAPVLTNDADLSKTGATLTINSAPIAGGTLSADGLTYTPPAGFVGVDTYTYTLTKNGILSNPVLVTVHVKPAGVADEYFIKANTQLIKDPRANDGTTLAGAKVTVVTPAANGSGNINANDQLIYVPNNNFTGVDNLTYTLTLNGEVSDPIAVKITVFTTGLTLTKVATNTVSKVGDVINYAIVVKNTGSAAVTNVIVSDPGADAGSVTPSVIPTLAAGASANVTAKHTLTQADVDKGGYVNQATVVATDPAGDPIIGPPSDDPNTAAPGDGTNTVITPNTAIKLTKTGVAAINDITYTFLFENIGNTTLTAITLTDAKLGINALPMVIPNGALLPGQSFTYTSVYTLTDADKTAGSVDNTATATGTDTKGNTGTSTGPTGTTKTTLPAGPTAVDDAGQTSGNQPVLVYVLDNDKAGAAAIDKTTVVIVAQPAFGTVAVNADGSVVYTPSTGFPGTDTYTYKVKDANGYYSNVATVTINGGLIGLNPPTLFTPNGDGVNDTFEIRGLSKFAVNDLQIVNRWGNQVFKATDYQNNWTGEGLNEGTYYYILRLKLSAGDANWITVKGWTTLLRTFKR